MSGQTHPIIGVDIVAATPDLIGWRPIPRPKPDLDEGLRAFHSEQAASIGVEGGSKRVSTGIQNTTPSVVVHESVAVVQLGSTGLRAICGHGAPRGGVEGHLVRARVVRTLNDVDFPCIAPAVQAGLPDCGPCATALRHVPNVEAVGGGVQHQKPIPWTWVWNNLHHGVVCECS